LEELHLRKRLGISVLAINRGSEVFREEIRNMQLRAGDMLVFHSFWRELGMAASRKDFVVVTDYPKEEQRPHKLGHALFAFALALGLALSGEVAVPVALMTGVVGMLLMGVINMDEAYASINWKAVFIMACLIPLGWAVDSSGVANFVAQQTLERFGALPSWALLAILGTLTAGLGLVVSNVGATVIMVPMAINIAISTGANPVQFAVVVALCASNNFLTGSNPVLAMITGPAGYRVRDLLKVGLPLSSVYLIVVLGVSYLMF
jgi:di/tricarboxylate transporter